MIQEAGRLTLVGDAARAGGNLDALRARYLNFDFEQPVTNAASAREALVAMAHKARAA